MKVLPLALSLFCTSSLGAKEMESYYKFMNGSKKRFDLFLERSKNLPTTKDINIDSNKALRKSNKPKIDVLEEKNRGLQNLASAFANFFIALLNFFASILISSTPTTPTPVPSSTPLTSTPSNIHSSAPSSISSSVPSSTLSNTPSTTFSRSPSSTPSNAPSMISSSEPSSDMSKTWQLVVGFESDITLISSDGSSAFIMFPTGALHYKKFRDTWVESIDTDEFTLFSLVELFQSVWDEHLEQIDFLSYAMSAEGNNLVSVNRKNAEVVVFFKSGNTWAQRGDTITSDLIPLENAEDLDYVQLLDISNDGLSILFGSVLQLYLFEFDTSWVETGSLFSDFNGVVFSDIFLTAKMNFDASTVVVVSTDFSDNGAVTRYSLPAFEEVATLDVGTSSFYISLSDSGDMIAYDTFLGNGGVQLNLFAWNEDAQQYIQKAVLDDYFMIGDLFAGDGPAFFAFTGDFITMESLFRLESLVLVDDVVVTTGIVNSTDLNFRFPRFSVSGDGNIFTASAENMTVVYEAL